MNGTTVFITGAARGIGADAARRLHAEGANVALTGLEPSELEQLAAELGDRALAIECDVTDPAALEAAVAQTVERFGGIDVVFANAGIGTGGLLRTAGPDLFERVIEVNLFGAWRTVRACLPQIIERKGYILINASLAPVANVFPILASYGVSKSGVESLGNSLRLELRHHGVDVGVAYFGWIGTDMVHGADAEHTAFKRLRESMSWPMAKTHPVDLAGKAVVAGVAKRKRLVTAPRWIRVALPFRGLLTRPSEHEFAKIMPELERLVEEEQRERGDASSLPVGAGGKADARAREAVS